MRKLDRVDSLSTDRYYMGKVDRVDSLNWGLQGGLFSDTERDGDDVPLRGRLRRPRWLPPAGVGLRAPAV